MSTLSLSEVKAVVKELLKRYHAEYALLFGSYARGDATPDSDIDMKSNIRSLRCPFSRSIRCRQRNCTDLHWSMQT